MALALSWALVFLVPTRHSMRLFGEGRQAAKSVSVPVAGPWDLTRGRAVARRVAYVAGRLPWHSTCLVRAVAGMLLLRRRGIAGGIIRFGVKREGGALAAHAWLLLGEETLLGGEEAGAYVPLADIGPRAGEGRT